MANESRDRRMFELLAVKEEQEGLEKGFDFQRTRVISFCTEMSKHIEKFIDPNEKK